MLVAALLLVGPATRPAAAIVGGTPAGVIHAPWQAGITIGSTLCGGAIVGDRTVVTAAHCVVGADGSTPVVPGDVLVTAGASDLLHPAASAGAQQRAVGSVVVHPYYSRAEWQDDVALLRLATPLNLGAEGVRSIPLVPTMTDPVPGTAATITGYGQSQVGTGLSSDGLLRAARATIAESDDRNCSLQGGGAVHVCVTPGASGSCYGDSGGPLTAGSPAVLLATVEGGISPGCGVAGNRYANLAAPELRAFVDGETAIPIAPRGGDGTPDPPRLAGPARVGETLSCLPGTWTGSPSFTYTFSGGGRVQAGATSNYALGPADAGRQIACAVTARNAGGAVTARAAPSMPVALPALPAATATPRRPAVTTFSLKCRHRRCRLSLDVADPASATIAPRLRVTSVQPVRICRRGRCRDRSAWRTLRARRPGPAVGRFRATTSGLRRGRVEFRVTAISAVSGLRSQVAKRRAWVRP
jgi:hypothetical protein